MAQDEDCVSTIIKFMGLADLEEADPYEVERLSDFFHNPLPLNRSGVSDLEKSGLFTFYQIVSLTDYISRHGDVLSFTELSSVDGFSSNIVQSLSPFVSLDSGRIVGSNAETSVRQELAVKSGYKSNEVESYMYGGRYRMTSGRFQVGLSASRSHDAKVHYPDVYSGNVTWSHDKGKLIAGDFNARFGQGLCLWNSAVFSSLALPSAYMRKSTGVSPTNSFTGSSALTGLAWDQCVGKWKASAILALPGIKDLENVSLMPAVNIARYGAYGMASVTHMMTFADAFSEFFRIPQMRTSADAAICIKGVNVFGEAAFDWVDKSAAVVCGTDFMASEKVRMAFLLKYLPTEGFTNDYGAAISGEIVSGRLNGNFSLEGSYYPQPKSKETDTCCQFKAQTEWSYKLTKRILMELRVKERVRTWGFKYKTDVRIGVQYKSDMLTLIARFNASSCDKTGILGYVEGGYTPEKLSMFLRLGLFKVDDWDDRIYVYERDAPSNFNVPAYYGRGVWAAAYMNYHPFEWMRIYLRTSYMSYAFMPVEKRKPGKAELKIQCVFRF